MARRKRNSNSGIYQSLHCHTEPGSDGELSYVETLDVCSKNSIGVTAYTDHDNPMGEADFWMLKELRHPVKWISGIELTSYLPADLRMGDNDFRIIHIVGLFVDPFNRRLLDHCATVKAARVERMRRIVANIRALGFDISEKECLSYARGDLVASPHINSAILAKEKNLQILQALAKRMEKDSENNPELRKKYDEMIVRGVSKCAYFLFLGNDAYLVDVHVPHLGLEDADKTVAIIRNADGLTLPAHYTFDKKTLSLADIEKLIQNKRFDGLETLYGCCNFGEKREEIDRDMECLDALADKYNVPKSGGIDAHNESAYVTFATREENSAFREKTIGLAQDIIRMAKPNLTWSSFTKKEFSFI